jgi:hypothetical protein
VSRRRSANQPVLARVDEAVGGDLLARHELAVGAPERTGRQREQRVAIREPREQVRLRGEQALPRLGAAEPVEHLRARPARERLDDLEHERGVVGVAEQTAHRSERVERADPVAVARSGGGDHRTPSARARKALIDNSVGTQY